MLDAIAEFLNGKDFVKAGYGIWNALADVSMGVLGQTPSEMLDGSLWALSMNLMGVMKIIAASMFNLFFFMNFCKNSANLRDNQTMETVIMMFIKLLLGNLVIVNLEGIINGLCAVMQDLFGIVAPQGTASVALQASSVDNWDNDSLILGFFIGFFFMIVCTFAGFLLILHVYGIFVKVYFYLVVGPLALATVPGPEGAARTAGSWFKTMICALGEFAGTALVLRFCAVIINSSGFLIPAPEFFSSMEAAWNTIQAMLTILLTIGAVKAVDSMLRRSFGF